MTLDLDKFQWGKYCAYSFNPNCNLFPKKSNEIKGNTGSRPTYFPNILLLWR